jgi:hypothetical protein
LTGVREALARGDESVLLGAMGGASMNVRDAATACAFLLTTGCGADAESDRLSIAYPMVDGQGDLVITAYDSCPLDLKAEVA